MSLTLMVVIATVMIPVHAGAISTMYVYTENGGGLRVRATPSANGEVLSKLPYGSEVGVESISGGWAQIVFGSVGSAYVMSRYLVNYKPAAKPVAPTKKTGNSGNKTTAAASGISALNAEFKTGVKVNPYMVIARPARASGWVNLRWAPSMDAELIATCPQGKQLTVLAELKNWYQVQDPVTGMIGFISRKYTSAY